MSYKFSKGYQIIGDLSGSDEQEMKLKGIHIPMRRGFRILRPCNLLFLFMIYNLNISFSVLSEFIRWTSSSTFSG